MLVLMFGHSCVTPEALLKHSCNTSPKAHWSTCCVHFLGANWCRINQAAALQVPGLVTFGTHLEHSRQDFHKQLGGDGGVWVGSLHLAHVGLGQASTGQHHFAFPVLNPGCAQCRIITVLCLPMP